MSPPPPLIVTGPQILVSKICSADGLVAQTGPAMVGPYVLNQPFVWTVTGPSTVIGAGAAVGAAGLKSANAASAPTVRGPFMVRLPVAAPSPDAVPSVTPRVTTTVPSVRHKDPGGMISDL